ncbi:MAG: VWA domain-containing protein [Phycisphaerae bacterium]|nr:VWA domain-containing protein [Phycisphaerae bacterium]
MTFLAPLFALAALAAVPIVLLYLLKMKRQERVIPSTLLWQETIKDIEANVPFQRLRANLLLILQMLVLALLVAALMRPAMPSTYRLADRNVLVVDVSASMLATDVPGGATRFERARELASDLIDSLDDGQRMMILAGDRMVTDGFIEQTSLLHRALDRIEPREAEADVAAGLQLAQAALTVGQTGGDDAAGADGAAPADAEATASTTRLQGRVYLISDGAGLELSSDLGRLADDLTYLTVGSGGENAGILGLQFDRGGRESDSGELFVSIGNFSASDRALLVSLRRRGEHAPIDARELTLAAGKSSGVTFARDFAAGEYEVTLDGRDALALDDRACVVIGPNRPLKVLLVARGGGSPVERFLALADCVYTRVAPEQYDPADGSSDLYIFDGFVPAALPADRTTVLLAPERGVGAFRPLGVLERPRILDWKRDDPVMRFVTFADVRLAPQSALAMEPDPRIVPLVWSEDTALIGYEEQAGVRHYCVGFRLDRSTWPGKVSFVLMMGNLLDEARRAQRLGQALVGQSGRLWSFGAVPAGTTVAVRRPDGATVDVTAAQGLADLADTHQVGFYEASLPDGRLGFAMNLVSVRESNAAPQVELRGLAGEAIRGRGSLAGGTEEVWFWVTLAALAVLAAEWYVYHRRIA